MRAAPLLRRLVSTGCALTLIGGCTVSRDARQQSTGEVARDAAMQPLSDIGAVKPEIDPELERIEGNPYALSKGDMACGELAFRITQLNRILGPDYDVDLGELGINEKRARFAIGFVGGTAAGMLIPFRGVVREISGARKNEQEYRAALTAGITRRAYLKGIAKARKCKLPPDPYVESLKAEAARQAAEEAEE